MKYFFTDFIQNYCDFSSVMLYVKVNINITFFLSLNMHIDYLNVSHVVPHIENLKIS